MLSIPIDTKSLELVIHHQFNNIKLSFFASYMKSSFPLCRSDRCCTVIRYSRVSNFIGCAQPIRIAQFPVISLLLHSWLYIRTVVKSPFGIKEPISQEVHLHTMQKPEYAKMLFLQLRSRGVCIRHGEIFLIVLGFTAFNPLYKASGQA